VLGLEKVDQKPHNSFIKPMEMIQLDEPRFSNGGSALEEISKFRSDQDAKTACSTILLKLAANGLQLVFEKWVERYKKCIACQGRHFEKGTVTAPPQSSESE
jgi:hypothetical protein